ncbi:hypothetical protein SAMN05421785_11078 [Chryseobacterium gambrini]|uniref:Uncharacterized protein n=1 Tax=Chryseobacterium gambrini TaxID=373672 RepID=A0A1N7QCB7_9FLAO|nr:hypothetical protein SAMN05421785_11078 [Chryseobacterium gambrini]
MKNSGVKKETASFLRQFLFIIETNPLTYIMFSVQNDHLQT